MSSTGTSTVISIGFTRPASMIATSRLVPPRKRAVSDSGRCVAESPMRCGSVFVIAERRSRLSARWAPRLVSAIEWISSTITQRMLGRIRRAALVRRRKSDSGVVIKMSGGWRSICRRSRVGVSPVRIATLMGDCVRPIRSACSPMPRSGAWRLRSIATVRALMLAGGEHGSPLFEQSGVIRRRAPDTLAQRHDFTVEVIELAARATLEALKGRRPIRAVGWEIAGQPLAEHEVAERHGKRRHQTKGACPATLIETKSTKLSGPDTFTNRGDRQAGESVMAQRLADRQAGDCHDGVVQVRHQLRPSGTG